MSDTPIDYHHVPVLLEASVQALIENKEGIYVDGTFGGGGHSRHILQQLKPKGKLFAFDQDPAVLSHVPEDPRFTLVPSNFRYLKKYLRYYKIEKIDGIVLDLGLSSAHIDQEQRGFSFRSHFPLDMRMNTQQSFTAKDVLMKSTEEKLSYIFSEYGELTNSKKIALQWIKVRQSIPIHRCVDFADWASGFSYGKKSQFLAQLFQALRIEVNQELEALKEVLAQSEEVIQSGGRLVIISYHSLEDRLAKQWTRYGNPTSENPSFSPAFKQAILPNEEEIKLNSRARSAKMRVGIKK